MLVTGKSGALNCAAETKNPPEVHLLAGNQKPRPELELIQVGRVFCSAPRRIRTLDQSGRSRLLCPLSYGGKMNRDSILATRAAGH